MASTLTRACARAPVRADPAGGGTDAPPFSIEHGGRVVNFAVARHVHASVDRRPAGEGIAIYSEDLAQGVTAASSRALPGGRLEFLQAFVRRLVPEGESVLLVTESDVPASAGVGGSGALGVAVAAAIDRAFGRERTPLETAALANEIERKDLGYPGGSQDSFGAALGGINDLEYLRGGGLTPRRIDVPLEARLALERRSLLIYTSEAHVSGSIHRDIRESYGLPDSPTLDAMMCLREAAGRMAEALRRGDLDSYAEALSESCRNLYRLHPSCSSDAHRRCFEALEGLIAGGKTCGAGGGGFLLAFARPGLRRECMARAGKLGFLVWPVTIDFEGVRTWSEPPLPDGEVRRLRDLAARDGPSASRGRA
jgi:D-glycero-alpha-D-manno-heptose-7-phosphate kinase